MTKQLRTTLQAIFWVPVKTPCSGNLYWLLTSTRCCYQSLNVKSGMLPINTIELDTLLLPKSGKCYTIDEIESYTLRKYLVKATCLRTDNQRRWPDGRVHVKPSFKVSRSFHKWLCDKYWIVTSMPYKSFYTIQKEYFSHTQTNTPTQSYWGLSTIKSICIYAHRARTYVCGTCLHQANT